jgi:hypothetical protein
MTRAIGALQKKALVWKSGGTGAQNDCRDEEEVSALKQRTGDLERMIGHASSSCSQMLVLSSLQSSKDLTATRLLTHTIQFQFSSKEKHRTHFTCLVQRE